MFKKISQNVTAPFKFGLTSQILVHSLWHVCTDDVGIFDNLLI